MSDYIYITAATGKDFIRNYTQHSLKSLIKCDVGIENIFCAVRTEDDHRILIKKIPEIEKQIFVVNANLSKIKWTYMKGKRKYSYFKAKAIYKSFYNFKREKYLIQFDGDVLWYKNPEPFFDNKKEKTWFHHGKNLQERCKIPKKDINVKKYDSLKKFINPTWAYLFIKYGLGKDRLPDREVVAGLYLLHPRDREVLKATYEGCKIISEQFGKGKSMGEGEAKSSEGEQKPFNAALCKLNVDWHGGSRFMCPEHTEYFDHFFGAKEAKELFIKKVKKMGLR